MAEITDARDAMNMVRSLWHVGIPEWDNFKACKKGYTWIVTYDERLLNGRNQHEVRINAKTGSMVTIK